MKYNPADYQPIFKYIVICGDYNLSGYNYNETYRGIDREKAFAAYKEAKDWMGMVEVEIIVLGREKEHYNRLEEKDDEEDWGDDWLDGKE